MPAFCARVTAGLPAPVQLPGKPGRERIGNRVEYYRASDPPGTRWALPDQIACSKLEDYGWQDEFRLVFSVTSALGFENVSLSLAPGETAPAKQPAANGPFDLAIAPLRDICRLAHFPARRLMPRAGGDGAQSALVTVCVNQSLTGTPPYSTLGSAIADVPAIHRPRGGPRGP